MISKIGEEYSLDYLRLGHKLNDNFSYLFNLDDINNKPYNYVFGYILDNKLVGFIHIILTIDEADIVNIIVDDFYQKKGIGKKLIEYIIKRFNLVSLNLEVRENNDAIKFYEKMGFEKIRIIKNYYKDENAIFMKKVIK